VAVLWDALKGLLRNDGFELAGYIAFSGLLALFPFVIFVFALSGLLSTAETVQTLLEFLFRLAPADVAGTLAPVIVEILTQPPGGLLPVSLLFAIWAASSGVDALRLSLNRAYGFTDDRSMWRLKLQSLLYVMFGGCIIVAIALLVLLGPILLRVIDVLPHGPVQDPQIWILAQYGLGAMLISLVTGVLHLSLPMRAPRLRQVFPGAVATGILWLISAWVFTVYLAAFADYSLTYGTLGGVVITLFFFDISALIFIFGAELNGSLWRWYAARRTDQQSLAECRLHHNCAPDPRAVGGRQ